MGASLAVVSGEAGVQHLEAGLDAGTRLMLSRTVFESGWQTRVPVMLWLWGSPGPASGHPEAIRHPWRWKSVKSIISTLNETRFPCDL